MKNLPTILKKIATKILLTMLLFLLTNNVPIFNDSIMPLGCEFVTDITEF